jgi:SWI/SNF-related matrix-associated actin-dependent regulator 1 of chromatin subfamily A
MPYVAPQTIHRSIQPIVIINYDILTYWWKVLREYKPELIIIDESHFVKNNSAQRTKALKKLVRVSKYIIALSGTPIVNRPIEFFNIISILDPTLFPNYWQFAQRYCGAKHNGFGWDFKGATHTEELHKILTESLMIRRKKQDVLKDLPDKVYSFVPIELDNEKEYFNAEKNFIAWVRENKGLAAAERASMAAIFTEYEGLKQLAVKGKMPLVIRWIEGFLESDEKLVVFAIHKFVITELMETFGDIAVKIDGSVSTKDRQLAVDKFQTDDKIRLFVGNIKAAGVGITLTASSHVAFIEYPQTPDGLSQPADRCHRIGQKYTVNVHYLIAKDTIETRTAKMLDEKRKVVDSVVDGKAPEAGTLLTELIDSYINE